MRRLLWPSSTKLTAPILTAAALAAASLAGVPAAAPASAVSPGALSVKVQGIPAGIALPKITVAGTGSNRAFKRTFSGTAKLTGLRPGNYSVTPGFVPVVGGLLSTGGLGEGANTSTIRVAAGSTASITLPYTLGLSIPEGKSTLASGANHSCVKLTCWGSNGSGQLGPGDKAKVPDPGMLAMVVAGDDVTCAYSQGVYCWGLGYGPAPVKIAGLPSSEYYAPIADMDVSRHHGCAVWGDGAMYCWGRNLNGQLGNGTYTSSPRRAVRIPHSGVDGFFARVAVGRDSTCALNIQGNLGCWGNLHSAATSPSGGTTTPRQISVGLPGGKLVDLAMGDSHVCVVHTKGTVHCMGLNDAGQLGRDPESLASSRTFVQVGGELGVRRATSISAGGSHTCTVTSTSSAYCWGSNSSGQLGSGAVSRTYLPRAVAKYPKKAYPKDNRLTLEPWTLEYSQTVTEKAYIESGLAGFTMSSLQPEVVSCSPTYNYCLAKKPGTATVILAGGGSEYSYTITVNAAPVQPVGLAFRHIVAGSGHTCALDTTSEIYCWGTNSASLEGTEDRNLNAPNDHGNVFAPIVIVGK